MFLDWLVLFSYIIEWPLYLFSFMVGSQTFWTPIIPYSFKSVQWRRLSAGTPYKVIISDMRSSYAHQPKFNFDHMDKHANAKAPRAQ